MKIKEIEQRKIMFNELSGKTVVFNYFLWHMPFFLGVNCNSTPVFFQMHYYAGEQSACLLFSESIPRTNGITRTMVWGRAAHSDLQVSPNVSEAFLPSYICYPHLDLPILGCVKQHNELGNWMENLLTTWEWTDCYLESVTVISRSLSSVMTLRLVSYR